jgi:hypothetical protein
LKISKSTRFAALIRIDWRLFKVGYSILTKVLLQLATKEVPRCIDVANLIIFISKMAKRKKNQNFHFLSFSRKNQFHQVCEISPLKKKNKKNKNENCRKFWEQGLSWI